MVLRLVLSGLNLSRISMSTELMEGFLLNLNPELTCTALARQWGCGWEMTGRGDDVKGEVGL